jgi:hypothetical protein
MKLRPLLLPFVLAPLLLGACARHYVVERNFGRIDGERAISTNSDPQWSIQHEPAKDPSKPEPQTVR